MMVADAWRETLGLPLQTLDANDNFFDFGGSLLLLELISAIQKVSGTLLAVHTLLQDATLGGMAKALRGDVKLELIDIVGEADKFPLRDVPKAVARNPGAPIVAFLTGATGFLGAYQMQSLCRQSEIQTVICLVRANDAASARTRLWQTCEKRGMVFNDERDWWFAKVQAVPGDLTSPGLGVSLADIQPASIILHAGADVNWVKPYSAMAASNVGGTQAALEMAAEWGAPIIFASSITASAEPGAFNTGYRQTKEVAEELCKRARAQLGVVSSVMRFGDIGAPADTLCAGAATLPDDDFMVLLTRSCAAVGLRPDAPWAVSIMAVDGLADWVSQVAVRRPPSEFTGAPRDIKAKLVSWRQVWAWMRGPLAAVVEVPYAEWRQALDEAAADGEETVLRLMLVLPQVEGYLAHEGQRLAAGDGTSEELSAVDARWAEGFARAVAESTLGQGVESI